MTTEMNSIQKKIASYYNNTMWQYSLRWSYFHLHYGTKENRETTFRESLVNTTNVVAKHLRLSTEMSRSILDMGCGVGGSTIHLAKNYNARVTGINIATSQLRKAHRLAKNVKNVKFIKADYSNTRLKSNSFDGACGIESLCYSHDKQKTINEVYRILKNNGYFVSFDGFLLREEINLTNEEKKDYNKWKAGWLVPYLTTANQFMDMMKISGFKNVYAIDLRSHTIHSSYELFKRANSVYWIAKLFTKIPMERTKVWFGNVSSGRLQKICIDKKIWNHFLIVGQKIL